MPIFQLKNLSNKHPKPDNYRHPVLLLLLSLMLSFNILLALSIAVVASNLPNNGLDNLYFMFITFSTLGNIFFIIALYYLRKWAFYCLAGIALLNLGINIYNGSHVAVATANFFVIIVLYICLKLGGKDNAWDKLQ